MPWIEPKTDWNNGDVCTYEDVNRIFGNANYILGKSMKDDYTQYDLVNGYAWTALDIYVSIEAEKYDQYADVIDEWPGRTQGGVYGIGPEVTAENFNLAETWLLAFYKRTQLAEREAQARPYAGDGIYTSPLPEKYVR